MSLGLLFAGQGAQHEAMLPWLLGTPQAPLPQPALDGALGPDWRLQLPDPAWRRRNSVAQALVTGVSLAAWAALRDDLPAPSAIAGYSVGELAAYSAAGVLSPEQTLPLAVTRARLMDQAAAGLDTGLLSVDGLSADALQALCLAHQVQPALLLGPQHQIVGGLRPHLAGLIPPAEQAGARCQWLAIDLASHTSWLASAVPPWRSALDAAEFRPARCPVINNHDALARRDPAGLRLALAEQIAHPVPWDRCLDTLAERGMRCVLEIGPGDALSRMWNKRHPQVPARSVDQFQQRQGIIDWVRRSLSS